MGQGSAMSTICYTQLSAEVRETLGLGLAHGYSLRRALSLEVLQILGYKPLTTDWQVAAPKPPSRPHNLWKGCSVILSPELPMRTSREVGE